MGDAWTARSVASRARRAASAACSTAGAARAWERASRACSSAVFALRRVSCADEIVDRASARARSLRTHVQRRRGRRALCSHEVRVVEVPDRGPARSWSSSGRRGGRTLRLHGAQVTQRGVLGLDTGGPLVPVEMRGELVRSELTCGPEVPALVLPVPPCGSEVRPGIPDGLREPGLRRLGRAADVDNGHDVLQVLQALLVQSCPASTRPRRPPGRAAIATAPASGVRRRSASSRVRCPAFCAPRM